MDIPDWEQLRKHYDSRLIESLISLFSTTGPLEITAKFLSDSSGVGVTEATKLLDKLAAAGILAKRKIFVCQECDRSLTPIEVQGETCPYCQNPMSERPLVVLEQYLRDVPVARDIIWVLTLHGMNTLGAWQEDLNWLISKSYGRMVPVAIYKYGMVRPGAVLKFRQRALTQGLNARIRRLSGETQDAGFGAIPDVIAHSFGTWLLGHALRADPNLHVGKVILTGSILRPDFDWASLIKNGQVQEVLCHVATKDFWAGIAHYIIPDSGPSGRRGFNDRKTIEHAVLPGRCHSDFFKPELMPNLFASVWQPFLTDLAGDPGYDDRELPSANWKQARWPWRATVYRYLLLTIVAVIGIAAASALTLGAIDLWRAIR